VDLCEPIDLRKDKGAIIAGTILVMTRQ